MDDESGGDSKRIFDKLFERHRHAVKLAVSLRMDPRTRARFDESDVVQEAYTEAFRRLDDYVERKPMPFHLWLRETALERLAMLKRKHVGAEQRSVAREQRLPADTVAQLARDFVAPEPSPSAQITSQELATKVRQAISRLAIADQQILLLRSYEGLDYREVAELLDIEKNAARKRYGRALLRLQQSLADDGMSVSQL